jgi:formate dehydrogenase subunit gamma
LDRHLAWDGDIAIRIISDLKSREGALLPILHALQEEFGYIHPAATALIADALNIGRAEVHGTITFYPDFRRTPPATHTLKLCRAEACQSRGAERLAQQAREALGVGFGGTTADGDVQLEAVYCLGLCSVAPSAMLDGRIVARLDDDKLASLLEEVGR